MFQEVSFSSVTKTQLFTMGAVLLFLSGIATVGYGLWVLFISPSTVYSAESPISCDTDANPEEKQDNVVTEITVAASGAVTNPGVYTLQEDARVGDLVAEAGGFSKVADPVVLSQSLNLARSLADGEGVYIPQLVDEEVSAVCAQLAQLSESTGLQPLKNEKQESFFGSVVSVNTASNEELESLSGIGEKRAEAIIGGRPYTQLDQLVEQKILSESLFSELKDLISL